MTKFRCLNCKTEVVTFHDYGTPRNCKKCDSGPAWLMVVQTTSGPLPGTTVDGVRPPRKEWYAAFDVDETPVS